MRNAAWPLGYSGPPGGSRGGAPMPAAAVAEVETMGGNPAEDMGPSKSKSPIPTRTIPNSCVSGSAWSAICHTPWPEWTFRHHRGRKAMPPGRQNSAQPASTPIASLLAGPMWEHRQV